MGPSAAAAPAAAPSATGLPSAAEQERLVQMITDRVLEALRKS
jgi:hypothetical protein